MLTSYSKQLNELFDIIADLASPEDCKRFFTDLCTPQELKSLSDRWQVAKLIYQQVPYHKISELTGASTATITRVARSLLHGESGYHAVLHARLGQKN